MATNRPIKNVNKMIKEFYFYGVLRLLGTKLVEVAPGVVRSAVK